MVKIFKRDISSNGDNVNLSVFAASIRIWHGVVGDDLGLDLRSAHHCGCVAVSWDWRDGWAGNQDSNPRPVDHKSGYLTTWPHSSSSNNSY